MKASFEGHVEVVRALIGSQAQINTRKEVYSLLLSPEHTLHITHCIAAHDTITHIVTIIYIAALGG